MVGLILGVLCIIAGVIISLMTMWAAAMASRATTPWENFGGTVVFGVPLILLGLVLSIWG